MSAQILQSIYVHICRWMSLYSRACMCAYVCVRVYACIHSPNLHIYAYVVEIHMYTHMYALYVNIHTYTHTHMHYSSKAQARRYMYIWSLYVKFMCDIYMWNSCVGFYVIFMRMDGRIASHSNLTCRQCPQKSVWGCHSCVFLQQRAPSTAIYTGTCHDLYKIFTYPSQIMVYVEIYTNKWGVTLLYKIYLCT